MKIKKKKMMKVIFIRKVATHPRNRLKRKIHNFFSDGKNKY